EEAKRRLVHSIAYANPITHTLTGVNMKSIQRLLDAIGQGWHASPDLITDEMVDLYSISGTPDDVIEKLRTFEKEGIQLVYFRPGSRESYQLMLKEVIPSLKG
ncbi:unnamed protein product, partial [marine sediment metagenome]